MKSKQIIYSHQQIELLSHFSDYELDEIHNALHEFITRQSREQIVGEWNIPTIKHHMSQQKYMTRWMIVDLEQVSHLLSELELDVDGNLIGAVKTHGPKSSEYNKLIEQDCCRFTPRIVQDGNKLFIVTFDIDPRSYIEYHILTQTSEKISLNRTLYTREALQNAISRFDLKSTPKISRKKYSDEALKAIMGQLSQLPVDGCKGISSHPENEDIDQSLSTWPTLSTILAKYRMSVGTANAVYVTTTPCGGSPRSNPYLNMELIKMRANEVTDINRDLLGIWNTENPTPVQDDSHILNMDTVDVIINLITNASKGDNLTIRVTQNIQDSVIATGILEVVKKSDAEIKFIIDSDDNLMTAASLIHASTDVEK